MEKVCRHVLRTGTDAQLNSDCWVQSAGSSPQVLWNETCCFVVQSLSCVQLFVTPWAAAGQAPLSFTISQSLFKFLPTESVMLFNPLVLCHLLLLLPSIFPSIRVFSNELALCISWPKCWSFSFSISPSNEYSGLISLRIDCFYAVQGTCESLLCNVLYYDNNTISWCVCRGRSMVRRLYS